MAVIAPKELYEFFAVLRDAYTADPSGHLLVYWFRQDWGLFDHPRMDDYRAAHLVAEILDDGEIVRQAFLPAKDIPAAQLTKWERIRHELMYRNRFFPQVDVDLDRLQQLLAALTLDVDEVPACWYRARIQPADKPFPIDEMGAPPNRVASHGRANPAGIPYLYLASNPKTAISELRPHTGETACVADFATHDTLKLVDLRSPRKMVSPFIYADAEDVLKLRADLPFLERLGDELTRPVLPQSAAIDYTPSQYLCEFIKKCGYQGVVYRSSVSEGINLALFDPSIATAGKVEPYRVGRVSIDITLP